MKLIENEMYLEDIKKVSNLNLPWNKLQNMKLLISGITGLVGSFLLDILMYKNKVDNLNCTIYGICRNMNKAKDRFNDYRDSDNFILIEHDINKELDKNFTDKIDYVLHLASNTHPKLYATEPISTITTNIIGTKNMLDFAVKYNASRFLFASSNEIYGENRGDVEKFDEEYCGYIDCNTLRAGYPESKRCGEALCQAYLKEKNLDIVIARLTRSYGPTILKTDTKAISQFISKAINDEDIALKSDGSQYYSFLYVCDSVSGLLKVLLEGQPGNAYNIADEQSDIRLKDLANLIASTCNRKVIFDLPDSVEKEGFSKATKARLDSTKLNNLGWKPLYNIEDGVKRTIKILKKM